jgi:hypothetical protein
MRFRAASLGLVVMMTSIAPALAQEAPSAEPAAPVAQEPAPPVAPSAPVAPVDEIVQQALAEEAAPAERAAPSATAASEAAPTRPAPAASVPDWRTWPEDPDATPKRRRKSPGMVAGGSVLTALGGLGTILGFVDLAHSQDAAAKILFPTSGVLLAIGIPLIAVGASGASADGSTPTAQAELRVGAGSAEFSMEF